MRRYDGRTAQGNKVLRRPKGRPCEDFWHTLLVGLPIAALLFLALPLIFALIGHR